MKKIVAVIIVIAMMIMNSAFAIDIDFAQLTEEELTQLITYAINERWRRNEDHGKFFTDNWNYKGDDGLCLRLKDIRDWGDYAQGVLEVFNDTENAIVLRPVNAKVNGWDVDFYCNEEISAYGRRRCSISFQMKQADIRSVDEIDTIELSFEVENTHEYRTLYTIGPLYYKFNAR